MPLQGVLGEQGPIGVSSDRRFGPETTWRDQREPLC